MTEHNTKFTAADVVVLYKGAERKQYNFNAADVVEIFAKAYAKVTRSSKAKDIINAYASNPITNYSASASKSDDVDYMF